jgi:hypothetical protein
MTRQDWRTFAFALAILAIFVAIGIGWHDCARRGGTYVRGVVWMRCIR